MILNNFSKNGIPQKDLEKMKAIEKYFPNCYKYGMRYVVSTLEKQSKSSFEKMEFCDNMLSFLTILKIMSSMEKLSILKTLEDFSDHVKTEDSELKGNFLKFSNGLVYDCDFNYYDFLSAVQDCVFFFEDCAIDLECSNIVKYGRLRTNVYHFLSHIIKHKDNDEEMSSFEYAEMCFIKGLHHQLQTDKKIEQEIDNVLNTILE